MDPILGQFLDEQGMINFIECFGVVQIDAVSVITIKEVLQNVVKVSDPLCVALLHSC